MRPLSKLNQEAGLSFQTKGHCVLDEGQRVERKRWGEGGGGTEFLKEWLAAPHSELELYPVSQLLPHPDTESESRKGRENAEFKDHILNTRKETREVK